MQRNTERARIHASCHVVVRRWNSDGVSVANLACNKGKRQTCPTAIDSGALMTQVRIRVNPGFAPLGPLRSACSAG
ncbi:hypothetical protein BOS5A_130023 [Bosea sp. EC-HK365B]|nr:hypothetical protein BOSE7B_30089 [Bosea sp. 7B]VVT55917.1 hypothetical protein BOS5A_130023 [Bosea sp. EC-HK365B]